MTEALHISLAPLQGFTDFPFRKTIAQHASGIDVAYSPFIATNENPEIAPSRLKDVWPDNKPQLPVIPQVLTHSPKAFIRMADALWQLGYSVINWNLGCPFPVVVKKQKGSGLLPHPERIDGILNEVIPAIRNTLSIKCRLGWDSPKQIMDLVPVFNRYPLHEVIIHPRLGTQKYSGKLDLNTFAKAATSIQAPVVFNGDISNLDGWNHIHTLFPEQSRFMIGRGLIQNPFLAEEIRMNKELNNKVTRFQKFHTTLFEEYDHVLWGPTHIVDRMKGFWSFFSLSFENGHKVFKQIKKCHDKSRYLKIVQTFFDSSPTWKEES